MTTSERQIPLLDLVAQHKQIRDDVLAEIIRVVDSQKFILGPEVQNLEADMAAYSGAKYGVGCASGSDALFLALLALQIRPGDEVLTTPYTFFATAGAISRLGAIPVFADVEEGTFNLDVNQAADVLKSRPKIRAIIPVHLFGGCADMDPICAMAAARGIPVIEDAAQSVGSEYKKRRAGGIGDVGCFSFFPSKNLGGCGDGGMLTTNNQALAERMAALRIHGRTGKYLHKWVGVNSRLDALQAAILRVKFRWLDRWTEGRQRNAERYRQRLTLLGAPVVAATPTPYQNRHVYNQFVIRGRNRDGLQAFLKEQGVGTEVYYPLPLHLQPCYQDLGYKESDFPVSEKLASESLALPIQGEIGNMDIDYICDRIAAFYNSR
jgi:dTDP-4-amino-4,6-dideoxygalactose transaminase